MGMKEEWERRQAIASATRYPNAPGYKDPGVSKENVERIIETGAFGKNMHVIEALFRRGFEGTADEAGEAVGLTPFQARPVCTHLRKANVIERTAERRTGAGGGTAAVLRLRREP